MRAALGRAAGLAFALLIALSPARAVDPSGSKLANIPADHYVVAPGGVDLRTGVYTYSATDLSIGPAGESGAISLTRTLNGTVAQHSNAFGNLSDNWDIMLTESRISIGTGSTVNGSGPDYRMFVRYGGRTDTFQAFENGGFQQLNKGALSTLEWNGGDRSRADVVYTYTANDGTVIVFRPLGGLDCTGPGSRCAYVSQMTEPDGTRFSFDYAYNAAASYDRARLRSVVSSRGYALLLEGSGSLVTKACVLNLAVTPLPADGVCPAGVATASYGYDGQARLMTVTDPLQQVSTLVYNDMASTVGYVKPGAAAPWLVNTINWQVDEQAYQQPIVSRQDFAGGQSYAYTYFHPPAQPGQVSPIAGGVFTDADNHSTRVEYGFVVPPRDICNFHPCQQPTMETTIREVTPGPVAITDPLNRVSQAGYCDPTVTSGCIALPVQWYSDAEINTTSDPEYVGIKTNLSYDSWRNVVEARRHPRAGSTLPDIVTKATYDCTTRRLCAKPQTLTDARNNVTTFTYDAVHGGVTTETGPAVNGVTPQKRYTYAARYARLSDGSIPAGAVPVYLLTQTSSCRTGNPAASGTGCALAGDEVITTYDYGPDSGPNNLLLRATVVDPGGLALRSCYAWDAVGNKVAETSPRGATSACPAPGPAPFTAYTRYDAARRVTGAFSIAPEYVSGYLATRNTYDPAGRLTKVETGLLGVYQSEAVAPSAWTNFAVQTTTDYGYDPLDRKTWERVTTSAGVKALSETRYARGGQVLCTAVRMNLAAVPGGDACAVSNPGSATPDRITLHDYNAAGEPVAVWRAYGTPLSQRYVAYEYGDTGKQKAVIDANGNRAEFHYDALDRQDCWMFLSKTVVGALGGNCTNGDFEAYGYDPNGNRTSLRKRDGSTLVYVYDALNRVTQKTVPASATAAAGYSVFYAYDLRGLQTEARFGSLAGPGVSNGYDAAGRQVLATTNMDGAVRTLTSTWDADGNRTGMMGSDGLYTGWTWDRSGRALNMIENPGVAVQFFYDATGRRSLTNYLTVYGSSASYHYDTLGRLDSLTHNLRFEDADQVFTFDYNPASQVVTRTSSNPAYRSDSALNVVRGYLANGLNQYTQSGASSLTYDDNGNLAGSAPWSYQYDAENRLVSATKTVTEGTVTTTTTTTLAYDPMGRLWQVSAPSGTTRFLYDGDRLIAEYDGAGNIRAYYRHGPGTDEPLMALEVIAGNTERRFYHADHQGSIVAIAGNLGDKVAVNAYDAWGIPNELNKGRFGYTGQVWLPELGVWYYKARLYSPTLGRFLQRDPIGYEDQINLYAYVGDDPVNRSDPAGTQTISLAPGAGCATCHVDDDTLRPVSNPLPRPSGRAATALAAGVCLADFAGCAAPLFNSLVQSAIMSPEDRRRRSKPTDAPTGTRPIDQLDIDKKGVHEIKDGIGAEPQDWVGIDKNGNIYTTDPQTGKAVPEGHVSDYEGSKDKKKGREREPESERE